VCQLNDHSNMFRLPRQSQGDTYEHYFFWLANKVYITLQNVYKQYQSVR